MPGPIDLTSQCNSHPQPSLARRSASDIVTSGGFSGSSVKRKRSHNNLPKPLVQSIAIKPCTSTYSASLSASLTNEPETFVPIQLLRRSSLPLSFLDSACSLPSKPLSRLFSAPPDLLDSLQGNSLEREATVLIVISPTDERLYAIENVLSSHGTYALCRLASWLTRSDVEVLDHVKGARERLKAEQGAKRRITAMQLGSEKSDWWHVATISGVSTEPFTKKRRIGGPMLKMEMPPPRFKAEEMNGPVDASMKTASSAPLQGVKGQKIKREATSSPAPIVEDPKITLSVDELTNNLIHQYLDSLYLSRTSLAYFAKGPLSRLRGAAGGVECVLSLLDLTKFLRSAMLSPPLLEKKYKETLPAVIRDIYVFDDDDDKDDGNLSTSNRVKQQKQGRKKKKRNGKSLKPAKNGLFPEEEEVIRKWWLSSDRALATDNCNSSSLSPFKSKVEAMKVRVAALRLREIFAQIIIALEIMAIERSSAFRDEGKKDDANGHDNVTLDKDNQGDANCKQRRTKKEQDVSLILDLLVDKLCIWRSIEQQDLCFKGSSRSEDGAPDSNASKTSKVSGNTDLLSDFSVEVVVPFYMHRLPEAASSLSSKLGGPKAPIPDRRSLTSSATSLSGSKTPTRPGDPAIRQVQLNQRRKIARVVSDTSSRYSHPQRPVIGSRSGSATGHGSSSSVRIRDGSNNGPKRIATLSRSATDTALPMLKCEAENKENELSLTSIPPSRRARGAGRDLISSRRQALSQCKRLSQREVDFDAMTKGKTNVSGIVAAATAINTKESSKSSSKAAEDGKRLQKTKKIEAVDAQLQDAISAIKKPDRRAAVGKEFEEAVERRGVLKTKGKAAARNGVSKGRDKLIPQHPRGLQQTIQVTATPKHPRASAMMMVHDRHSFGQGQYATTRDHHFHSSIPSSFSSAQVGANDRSKYQIRNQGQEQGQSQGYFAEEEEEGFIPSSAVRASTSMITAQSSSSPLQAISKVTVGGQQRYEENDEEEEETADILATPVKGQGWDIVGNISAGIAGRKFAELSTLSSSKTSFTMASAKAKAKASTVAVVIPIINSSSSSSYSSSSVSASASLSLHSSSPCSAYSASSPPPPSDETVGVSAVPVGTKMDASVPKTTKTTVIAATTTTTTTTSTSTVVTANTLKMQQQLSATPASPAREEEKEENIYRVLGWE